ncbi:MAG TPA: endonuclease/exonuclease/phosphatase family protein [Thermomicrobiales bacterium]|nr:endonuclease/exonuclease/phosphatase family protein [Thermomicrobiales bacterium]
MPESDLTVLTYNTGLGLASSDRLVEALLAADADIVGLQELDASLAGIGEALRSIYPYQSLHPIGIPGKGLLSRYPLREARLLPLLPGRPDLRAIVETDAGPIDLFVAHPPPLRISRGRWQENASAARQIRALAEAATAGAPAILLGDFNRLRGQQAYRLLRAAGLIDAFDAAGHGWGGTLPTRLFGWAQRGHLVGTIPLPPVLRVDYVWHTRHFTTLASWTGPHAGSDHLPVIARLRRG